METLRESKPSLLFPTPDSDAATHSLNPDREREHITRLRSTVDAVSYAVTPSNKTSPVQNRFARDFIDPLFPYKICSYAAIKRVFDLIVAMVMLIIAAPIMLVTAVLIKLTSPGPMIFKQIRVG